MLLWLLAAGLLVCLCFKVHFYLCKPRFQGQWVWVTGANSGIGEQLALAFARAGARLILSARNLAELERVRALCLHYTAQVEVVPLDLSFPTEVLTTAQGVLKQHPVDILVNNAGVSQRAPISSSLLTLDLEKKLFTINYLGQVALTKAVLPSMVLQRSGHIVYISSLAGLLEAPMRCFYGCSKAATSAYMESLRAEVAQYGITVTNIYPGFVQSNGAFNALGPDGKSVRAQDSNNSQGMSGQAFASLSLRHIAYRSQEVVIAQMNTRVFLWIKVHFPCVFDLLAPRMFRRFTDAFESENS